MDKEKIKTSEAEQKRSDMRELKEGLEKLGIRVTTIDENRIVGQIPLGSTILEDGAWCNHIISISIRFKEKLLTIKQYELNDPYKSYSYEELEGATSYYSYHGLFDNLTHINKILYDVAFYNSVNIKSIFEINVDYDINK